MDVDVETDYSRFHEIFLKANLTVKPEELLGSNFRFLFSWRGEAEELIGEVQGMELYPYGLVLYISEGEIFRHPLKFLYFDSILKSWQAVIVRRNSQKDEAIFGELFIGNELPQSSI